MNRFVSASLAGAIALSAMGLSATGASADRWHHPYRGPAAHGDVGPALVAGAIFGLAVGSMMQPSYPAYRDYRGYRDYRDEPPYDADAAYAAEAHFQWCTETYQSYNGETDTWTDYRGIQHRCVSP